jgi:hypothetical protein
MERPVPEEVFPIYYNAPVFEFRKRNVGNLTKKLI